MILKQTLSLDLFDDLREVPDRVLEISSDERVSGDGVRARLAFVLETLPGAIRSSNAFHAATDLGACARSLSRIESLVPADLVPALLESVGTLRSAEQGVARLLERNLDRAVAAYQPRP